MRVTATQIAAGANGILLRIYVLTGAKPVAQQAGGLFGTGVNGTKSNTTAYTGAASISAASSRVYGAADHDTHAYADTGSGTTLVDDFDDTVNLMRYVTFKQVTPGTGSQTLGVTAGGNCSGGVCWLEVQASGTLAEDASAPGSQPFTATGAQSVQSGAFTPPGGSLIVALVSSDGGTGTTTVGITDDAGGLNWTQKALANTASLDYCGVWIADAPGGGSVTANPGQASGSASAPAPAATAGTGLLYAGADAQISGTWANLAGAVGSGQGTYATWTDSGSGTSAVLELSSFGAQAAVPAGATVGDVKIRVRHSEDPAAQVASVTAQAYLGASPYGTAQPLTVSATVHEDEITVTGLTRTDLADLRVRITATRD